MVFVYRCSERTPFAHMPEHRIACFHTNASKALKQNFRRVKIKITKTRISFPSAGCLDLLFVYSCSKKDAFLLTYLSAGGLVLEGNTFDLCTSSVRKH